MSSNPLETIDSNPNSSASIPSDYSSVNFSSNSNQDLLQRDDRINNEVMICGSNSCTAIDRDTQEMITDQDQDTQVTETEQDKSATDVEVNFYLNEPMLIRESTDNSLPQNVVRLYGEAGPKSSFGAMAVLLKVLMNELGYTAADAAALVFGINSWNNGQSFRMNFVYPAVEKSNFSLLLVPVHKTLLIYGSATMEDDESMNVKLPIAVSDFVNSNISDNIYETYKGSSLSKLSRAFKDSVAYPLLQFALAESGLCTKPGLITLVSELQIAIFKHLDISSLLRLSEVCSHLNTISKDRAIWRHLLLRDFGMRGITANDLREDWTHMYRDKYAQKKRFGIGFGSSHCKHSKHFAVPGCYPPFIVPFGGDVDLNPLNYDPFGLLPRPPFPPMFFRDPMDNYMPLTVDQAIRQTLRKKYTNFGGFAGGF